MQKPAILKKGDAIAIVAPARKTTHEQTAPAISLFRSWGLNVVEPDHLYDEYHQFAGNDATRAATFQSALDNPEIKAIICARGGYGCVRIIDSIDFTSFGKHPKWIIGFSDITTFHNHIATHYDTATLHATMPIDIPTTPTTPLPPSLHSLHRCLFDGENQIEFPSHPLNRIGDTKAPIVGGNLSIIYSLCGSQSDIDTKGKILFIEDLDEYLYHIDRMMQNLKRTGKLSSLKGLIVGHMNDMHDNSVPFGKSAEEIISEAVREYDFPVCFNAPIGHIGTDNHALLLGVESSLSVTENGCALSQSIH